MTKRDVKNLAINVFGSFIGVIIAAGVTLAYYNPITQQSDVGNALKLLVVALVVFAVFGMVTYKMKEMN